MLHTAGLARAVEQPRSRRTYCKLFFHQNSELSLEGGIILWGNRVVVFKPEYWQFYM